MFMHMWGGNPVSYTDPMGEFIFLAAFGPSVAAAIGDAAVLAAAAWGISQSSNINKPDPLDPAGGKEHTSGARPSTGENHETGEARRRQDRGGEKGDDGRDLPRRRPDGWKGSWPPKTPNACEN